MGRVGENTNPTPNFGNEVNLQTRSTLHPQENQDYQPAAFPPPPEKAHAFPPPQADQLQTEASYPPYQQHPPPSPYNEQQHMQFQATGQNNGGSMHGGGMGKMNMNMPPAGGSPYNNPAFQPTPQMGMGMPAYGQQQPGMGQFGVNVEPWRSTLFDCFDDPENALITACFPCVTFGQIAEIVDQGQSSCATSGCIYTAIACCIAMPCLISCTYRSKMRDRFRLVEAPGPDWLIHCFCECCALCQEYRELKLRGYDPTIGWLGNAARMGTTHAGSVAMTPPMQPTMMGR